MTIEFTPGTPEPVIGPAERIHDYLADAVGPLDVLVTVESNGAVQTEIGCFVGRESPDEWVLDDGDATASMEPNLESTRHRLQHGSLPLDVDITEDTVTIVDADGLEVAHWICDEIAAEPAVAVTVANAVHLAHTDPVGLLEKQQAHLAAQVD